MDNSSRLTHRRLRPFIATVAGLGAAFWLSRSLSFDDLNAALTRLTLTDALLGFSGYLLLVGAKAARFGALLGGGFSRRTLFGIVAVQTFWSNLLPMRAGEISYVYLLRDRAAVSATRGVASLLVASVLDLWWMLCLAFGLGIGFQRSGVGGAVVAALTTGAGIGVFGGIALLIGSRAVPEGWIRRAVGSVGGIPVVGAKLSQVIRELREQSWSRPFLGGMFFSSMALLLRFGFQMYLLARMFDGITPLQGVFALTFSGVVNLLPIQGVGNVGSIELPWAWALMRVGVGEGDAVASGFALHAVVLLYAFAVGGLGFALLGRDLKGRHPDKTAS